MKMKKMKLFALMFLAGALIFSSCKKDDEEETTPVAIAGPSITFQGGNDSLEFTGADIDVNVDFKADGKVSVFKLTFFDGDSIIDLTSTYKGEKSGTYRFVRTASRVGADLQLGLGKVVYLFTLTDKENNTKTAEYTVTVPAQNDLVEKTGYLYHIMGQLKGAYDLNGDSLVSSSTTATVKSLVNTDPSSDNSQPSSFTGSWNSGNGTEFVKANGFNYDGASIKDQLVGAFAAGTSITEVTNPSVGDIYIANKDNDYYAIKITGLNVDYTKSNHGQLTFTYKK